MKATESLSFEIRFYEKLLAKHPDFTDVMIALGDAYTKIGEYKKGLEIDRKLIKLKKNDETVFYNLACSYALLEMHNEAFNALRKSVELGYEDIEHLQKDPDLQNIRNDKRFKKIVSKIKKKTIPFST